MSFSIELFPDEPILLCRFHADFDAGSEFSTLNDQSNQLMDSAPEPVFMISDVLDYQFSVTDLVAGASAATRGVKPAFFHPNVREVLWVTQSKLMELGAKGFNSPAFGNIEVVLFQTLDEALAYCREKIQAG